MKPIKIEDQELLALAEELCKTRNLMDLWSSRYIEASEAFWKAVLEKMDIPEKEQGHLVYNHAEKTIQSKGS